MHGPAESKVGALWRKRARVRGGCPATKHGCTGGCMFVVLSWCDFGWPWLRIDCRFNVFVAGSGDLGAAWQGGVQPSYSCGFSVTDEGAQAFVTKPEMHDKHEILSSPRTFAFEDMLRPPVPRFDAISLLI